MSVFTIASIDVHDPDVYQVYREKATAALSNFRVKSIIVSPLYEPPVVLEGQAPGHLSITEFESMEDVREFYNSPAYQAAVPYRHAAATTHYMIAVRGRQHSDD